MNIDGIKIATQKSNNTCGYATAGMLLSYLEGVENLYNRGVIVNIKYVNQISVDDYNYLRKSVGWAELESNQAFIGISNSAFLISAIVDDRTVGISRVVSDGGYIAIIVDVIVLPEFQGNSIGKTMMQKVMVFIKSNIKEGQFVFVNLMAAKDRESFYAQFGFETRPNEGVGAGMTQYIYYGST